MRLRRTAWALGFVLLTALLSCNPHSWRDPIPMPVPKTAPAAAFTHPIGIQFVVVPAGTVNSPYRDLHMPRSMLLSAHEITNAQYEKSDPKHKRHPASPGDDHPVNNVTVQQAEAFCKWLTRNDPHGRLYRLPDPLEWIYAARGGQDHQPYPWGDDIDKTKACYAAKGARPVGSYPPNGFGLYDVAGNVAEWTARDDYPPHTLRGGSWREDAEGLRFTRLGRLPRKGEPLDHHGFRVYCRPPLLQIAGKTPAKSR